MEVRWRLFARDVLSLLADSDGKFHFGRPPRPIGGLRLLGVAVHKARSGVANDPASRAGAAGAAGDVRDGKKRARGDDDGGYCSGNGSAVEGEFGLLGIDDGTGVVEVRMPLRLWEAVALGDQLDIVGVPERPKVLASTSNSPPAAAARPRRPRRGVSIKADGCYVEKDPNVATLRALECINLYKTCYFSRAWSPSAAPLPPLLLDPQPPERADGRNIGDGGVGADGGTTAATSAGDVEPHLHGGRGGSAAPPLEDILGLIGSLGGATAEQLVAKLGLPPGHAGVASALDQMQLDGAIYLAGDLFMPL